MQDRETNTYSECTVCKSLRKGQKLTCSICALNTHKCCLKISNYKIQQILRNKQNWFCPTCKAIFPFHNICDDELQFISMETRLDMKHYELQHTCTSLDVDIFECSKYKQNEYERNIDPDRNYFNSIISKCQYYTDFQFNQIESTDIGLSMVHFNCRSLNRNFEEIKSYLNELNHTFDIIAMSETWVQSINNFYFYLEGYDVVHRDRQNKRGGGVAIYIKNGIELRLINEMSLVIDNLLECITIEVCFKNQKNTVISCVYRTPNSDLDIFNEKINDILSKARGNKDIYICGDFNIDLLKHESNNGTNNFLNILYSSGLYPLIVKPTRITTHSYTLIDNIFTNNLCNENESGILINDISDHLPIFSMIRNKSVNTTKDTKFKIVRNNSETNIIAFKRAL